MAKSYDIVQRAFDNKWMVWEELDNPDVDRDWHLKNGLSVPQIWVPVAVTFTREAAVRATRDLTARSEPRAVPAQKPVR